jgi:hypothetical protein
MCIWMDIQHYGPRGPETVVLLLVRGCSDTYSSLIRGKIIYVSLKVTKFGRDGGAGT